MWRGGVGFTGYVLRSMNVFSAVYLMVKARVPDTSTFRRPIDRGDGSIVECCTFQHSRQAIPPLGFAVSRVYP